MHRLRVQQRLPGQMPCCSNCKGTTPANGMATAATATTCATKLLLSKVMVGEEKNNNIKRRGGLKWVKRMLDKASNE